MTDIQMTPTQARRLAIYRQRLAGPAPAPTSAGIMELFQSIRCVQLDPIRAVERTQFLVLWSRLGRYDLAHLDTLLWQEKRLFEYWAHAASIVLTEDYPIHEFHMRHFAAGQLDSAWQRRVRDWVDANGPFRDYVLHRLRTEGPLASSQIEDRTIQPWTSDGWNHNQNVRQMLSFLWEEGEIVVAARKGLQKKWALAEDYFPEWTPREQLTARETVRRAAQLSLRALGVGTASHINDHFTRGRYPGLTEVLAELEEEGSIRPVQIADWPGSWCIHNDDLPLLDLLTGDTWQPRTVLLSPFDNLIADRDRTELMWDFRFRIEIYVPKAKRQYGYYVLPILQDDRLIGRIDPKMERKTGILHVNAVYAEADAPRDSLTAQSVHEAITDLADFLEAKEIRYGQGPFEWGLSAF
jgi:uncharacterized protein YcaQ